MNGTVATARARRTRRFGTFGMGGLMALLVTQAAVAAWLVSSAPSQASARAATLARVTSASAILTDGAVTVSWAEVQLPNDASVDGYRVLAYPQGGGDPRTPSGTCATEVSTTTCTDPEAPPGPWEYRVSAQLGAWTGPQSDPALVSVPGANAIITENQRPGTPASEWDVSGAGDASIQGFATDISADQGGAVKFKIDTTAPSYHIDIYRLGWYGGDGARLVDTIPSAQVTTVDQPACAEEAIPNQPGMLVDCGNWSVSATWQVPADATSGIYIARPTRTDTGGASHIVFVVRDDDGRSDLLFQTSDTTWQAYNPYGGYNAYNTAATGTMAQELSYNRPFTTRGGELENWLFNSEYPMLRWLERNGYDVSYTTSVDSGRRGALIQQHRVFMSVGHDEYWSQEKRDAVTAARDAGTNLAFFSANEIYWKVRWEDSGVDGVASDQRTMVVYKEGSRAPLPEEHRYCYNNYQCDPSDIWTGLWREAPGATPENSLSGQISWRLWSSPSDAIRVPADYAGLRFWRNTEVANLPPGGSLALAAGTLGYEWDPEQAEYAASYPPGRITMSSTDVYTFMQRTEQHRLSLYRAPSGALVFGAGTVQWAWGLDAEHDPGSSVEDRNVQQATMNVLADMGTQPASPQTGLVATAASQDSTAPSTSMTSPSPGTTVAAGGTVSVTGTATDVGGTVAGVEVSVDGGAWRPATGTTTWQFTFPAPSTIGTTFSVRSRATDDSLNSGAASTPVELTTVQRQCLPEAPCSIFDTSISADDSNDTSAVEVGVKVRSSQPGVVSAIRFFKPDTGVQTYVGRLYSRSGELLGQGTGTPTGRGWQELVLDSPVAIETDVTYVASVYMPSGHYAYTDRGLLSATVNPPLTALADGADGGNGVYRYGSGGGFPTETFQASNYWVDVAFATVEDTTAPALTSWTPAGDATGVSRATTVTATLSESVDPGSATSATFTLETSDGLPVPATVTALGRTITLKPEAHLAAGVRYVARIVGGAGGIADRSGNPLPEDFAWAFTTSQAEVVEYTIFGSDPGGADDLDPNAVEVGVRFQATQPGDLTAVRFFKPDAAAQTYVGRLYNGTGQLLAEGTATLSGPGWQELPLTSPVTLEPDTTYVASVFMPSGHYAVTSRGLAAARVTPPLIALADGVDGGNGVYRYGGGFPTSTYQASNYWVDVRFLSGSLAPDTRAPTVLDRSPVAGAQEVSPLTTIRATFSESIATTSVSPTTVGVAGPAGALEGAVALAGNTVTFTPAQPLPPGQALTVTLRGGPGGITDLAGNSLAADETWSFTTREAAAARPEPTAGPGGPVLLVTDGGFDGYLAEILRAEGLNQFSTASPSALDAAGLAPYSTVVLARVSLSQDQVGALTDWVTRGGDLIAVRPDSGLADLLGLTPISGALDEGYLEVDTSRSPGEGITDATLQFHGTADLYAPASGTQVVATLFSDATTATGHPAVTRRPVGDAGGSAAAFTYDLAESIVLTRQGNPAWADSDRDGQAPFRANDLFYPDYVDRSKVQIPQADEQQRLLANLVVSASQDTLPLPRFWYLPRDEVAAIVMTEDEHNPGDVPARFDLELSQSAAGCSVDDWECIRSTVYLYPSYPSMTAAQARAYEEQGFEVALHPYTECASYSSGQFATALGTQLTQLATKYPTVAPSATSRNHCIAWSGYTTVPEELAKQGIHLDANYYYWPASWVQDRPGLFTGSGFPQRFSTADGTLIDVYQATTQMTDESGQTFPQTAITLMDNAIEKGYYGTFVANLHTDGATAAAAHAAVVAAAQARGVPVITAEQLLRWTDARNASRFRDLAWDAATGQLTFSLDVDVAARGLRAMLPLTAAGGDLTSLVGPSGPITWQARTVKGITYAVFPAAAGKVTATYPAVGDRAADQPAAAPEAADTTAPGVESTTPVDAATSVALSSAISVTFTEDVVGASETTLTVTADGTRVSGSVRLEGSVASFIPTAPLPPLSTITVTLDGAISDAAGNPLDPHRWSFVTAAAPVAPPQVDTLDPAAEVPLITDEEEFDGESLPGDWIVATPGDVTVSGGTLSLSGATVTGPAGPASSVEFSAALGGDGSGLGVVEVDAPVTQLTGFERRSGQILAVQPGTDPAVLADADSAFHDVRIEQVDGELHWTVDGEVVHTAHGTLPASGRALLIDAGTGESPLTVGSVATTRFASGGEHTSPVHARPEGSRWGAVDWVGNEPSGTSVRLEVRAGPTATPDDSWTAFSVLARGEPPPDDPVRRFLQYRLVLATTDPRVTPRVQSVSIG